MLFVKPILITVSSWNKVHKMNNYEFCAQWILDRIHGKNIRVPDYGCGPGKIVKALLRLPGLLWRTPFMAAFMLCAGLALTSARVEAAYTVVELAADLPAGSVASVRGLNYNGEVVGGGRSDGRMRGFLLRDDGTRQNFDGQSGSDFTVARGINLAGLIVGSTNTQTGVSAFRSLMGFCQLPLNPLSGDSGSEAFAINDAGQTVGYSSGPAGVRAVIWDRTGDPQELPGLPGSQSSRALAIDLQGNAVGVSEIQAPRAVLWKVGQLPKDLGALPGQSMSEAHAINGKGDIVGFSEDTETQQRHAVLWTSYGEGPIQDLGTLPNGASSWALGVSNSGQVVGTSQTKNGFFHAFLWTPESGMQDLNDLVTTLAPGTVLTDANAINSLNQILAIGRNDDRSDTAEADVKLSIFLLAPPPLPDVIVTSISYENGLFPSTVKNQGTAATPAGTLIGVGYLVDDVWRTCGIIDGPLAAGASMTIGSTCGAYTIPAGIHTISAYVDDINRFEESDETNNQFSQSVTVP
jgi:probable HAF family extracellular repeat protein